MPTEGMEMRVPGGVDQSLTPLIVVGDEKDKVSGD